MKCRYCKNEIPDGSIFCNWCGEKQIKDRKKKDEISVPKPRQLKSGKWNIELRAEGQSITEDTADLCITKAKAIRAGWMESRKAMPKITLRNAIDHYIERRSAVLSPSTIRGYTQIRDNRFRDVMDGELTDQLDWQKICNDEAEKCSAKTLKNAWGLIRSVLFDNGLPVPGVRLPQVIKKEKEWLTPEQILIFVDAVKSTDVAIPALMALCSLRRSEILAVTWDDVSKDGKTIRVQGAVVEDKDGEFTYKEENKNISSARTVPVLMPQLVALLKKRGEGRVVTLYPNTITRGINRVCRQCGLPEVGTHGLRHSFASLAYHLRIPEREAMLIGGWSDRGTMDAVYTHLSNNDIITSKGLLKDFFAGQQPNTQNKGEA